MAGLPFPSNENVAAGSLREKTGVARAAWKQVGPGQPPPLMLQLIFYTGHVVSYACTDIREMQKRDAGHIELSVYGMEKYRLTIKGRHLDELFDLLQLGRIKSMTELGPRTFDCPEEKPAIDEITIETLTGPTGF